MSELIVAEYVSLVGVVHAPGHSAEDTQEAFARGGWTASFMDDHRRYDSEFFQTAGAILPGRVTYEIWAGYWPTVTYEGDEIARALNTERRRLCVDRVALRAAPAGFVIGHLFRPQTLTILGWDEPRTWALVRKRRLRGWVPWRVLCKR